MINAEKKREIEIKTVELLEAMNSLNRFPVDLEEIANYLGIEVFNARFTEPKISGAIKHKKETEKDVYEILVKSTDIDTRKRFTIAHEIGHFILHQDLLLDSHYDDIMFRTDLSTENEEEANYFAGCLLMPEEAFIKSLELFNNDNEVQTYFEVSKAAYLKRKSEING